LKTETMDRIGLITSALFRAVAVMAWAIAIPEVSGHTKIVWLGAGALWWVQDIMATLVIRRQRDERREREKQAEQVVLAGITKVMGAPGERAN
jgi:hypothetical protein